MVNAINILDNLILDNLPHFLASNHPLIAPVIKAPMGLSKVFSKAPSLAALVIRFF
jgi:hypothetical protein